MLNKSKKNKIKWGRRIKTKLNPLGYYCPILSSCCYCIPLKIATFLIAVLGLVPTIMCIFLTTRSGNIFLKVNGIPETETKVLGYIYAGLGIIVFCCHVVLFVAAITRLKKLFAMYLWIMIFFIIVNLILAFIIGIETLFTGHLLFGSMYLLLTLLYTCLLIYFWIVIQSQLYNAKEEPKVINIHITII